MRSAWARRSRRLSRLRRGELGAAGVAPGPARPAISLQTSLASTAARRDAAALSRSLCSHLDSARLLRRSAARAESSGEHVGGRWSARRPLRRRRCVGTDGASSVVAGGAWRASKWPLTEAAFAEVACAPGLCRSGALTGRWTYFGGVGSVERGLCGSEVFEVSTEGITIYQNLPEWSSEEPTVDGRRVLVE